MIPSARAAALRSTALATSLALAVGLSAIPVDAWAKPKVPLPKPRPIARNVVPKTTVPKPASPNRDCAHTSAPAAAHTATAARRAGACAATARARDAPACRPAPSAQTRGAGGGSRDVLDLAGRQGRAGKRHRAGAQAQARGCDAGAGRDIGSGRPQARGMADPAQRQQWRFGRALPRLCLGQSELAVADLPAPAHRGRAVGRPPRRRHRLVVVRKRIADLGQGQVRAGEGHDRARRSQPMPNGWCARPGATTACRKTPRARRSTCSARC